MGNDAVRRCAKFMIFSALTAVLFSCAYFNTLYNAKKSFRKAGELPRDKDGKATRQQMLLYDEVIKKCEQIVVNYPNSKWVDDAILLMGKAFYEQGEYDEAIVKFEELRDNFPGSELNEEGQYRLARAYLAADKPLQAVNVLEKFEKAYPRSRYLEEVLFLHGTTLMKQGEAEEAAAVLERLATNYPESRFKVEADLEMGRFYLEKQEYGKSVDVLSRLARLELSDEQMRSCLKNLASAYIEVGEFDKALEELARLRKISFEPEARAEELLLRGKALSGKDSIAAALDVYKSVRSGFPKSRFSAEALFMMGMIYQDRMDSLELARKTFEEVPKQYPRSPFAREAIKRSVNISNLIKYSRTMGESDREEKAQAQFMVAEIQLFQFNNPERALDEYRKVLEKFGESELAPKAAYSIGYIYSHVLGDTIKAMEAFRYLAERYPDSQQAEYARMFLEKKGEIPDDPSP